MKDFNEIEQSFVFNENDFSDETSFKIENSFIKLPKKHKDLNPKSIKFSHAEKLVDDIDFEEFDRVYCRVKGNFIFGDFLEAFIIKKNIGVEELTIETLSLSYANVLSLNILLTKGYVQKLNLIVSDHFFSHEKRKLVPKIYELLNINNSFQFSVCRTHCKIIQFKTLGGKHIVIHGSSNLRSSDNIEQFVIENSEELYNFNAEYHKKVNVKFKTIG